MTTTGTVAEENKGYDRDGVAKRGKKNKRGDIGGSVSKDKGDDYLNNTKCKYIYILSYFQNN